METIKWKACIVAHSCAARNIERSVEQMHQAGWEESMIFSPKGVKSPDRRDVSTSRCTNLRADMHNIDYLLTLEALSAMTTGFLRDTTYILVTKPGMYCWEQMMHYCEAQIEPNRCAIWGLHTPGVMIESERRKRPEFLNGDGFYKVQTRDRLLALDCFVVNPVVATFLVNHLDWKNTRYLTFAQAIGELVSAVPALELFYHHRSLAMFDGVDCPDFVGVNYVMPNSELTELKALNY